MAKTYPASAPPYEGIPRMEVEPRPVSRPRISRPTVMLFLALAGYGALPIFKIPLLELSLSAVIFAFICLNLFIGSGLTGFGAQSRWLILAICLWAGVLLSLTSNSVAGLEGKVDLDNWRLFLRFSYYLLLFVVASYIATEAGAWEQLVKVLGIMILITALARLGEIALLGNVGAWSGTKLQTQNNYGILFSTYSPFVLVPVFAGRRSRVLPALALLLVWAAIALNGSRGSWVAVGLGTVLFFLMHVQISPRKLVPLLGLALLASVFALALVAAPSKFLCAVTERADTFQDLDRDKSWNTRVYQLRKGWQLFKDQPFAGVGLGGFTRFVVDVETDRADVSVKTLSSRSAHNAYIAYLAETGLAGSVPLALLLLFLTWRGYRAAIWWGRRGQYWALALYLSFLSMSIHLWVLHGIYTTGTWLMYGLTAGMITAASRAAKATHQVQEMAG